MGKSKILYAASTRQHLERFHLPYLDALREDAEVVTLPDGEIGFEKKYFCRANFRAARKIRRLLKRERFDAVILNTTLTAFWVRFAMLGMRKRPFVLNVVHGYLFPLSGGGTRRRVLLRCEKMFRRKTDAIMVMNREDGEIAGKYRLCKGKVYFSYGMGLPERVLPAPCPNSGAIRCVYVGELSKRKNQTFLIEAVDALREKYPNLSLTLVGEGAEKETLERLIREKNLGDRVTLAGNRNDVPEILAASDLYLSASTSEGLPFNLLEAMEAGLPIVSFDTKGQNDLLSAHPEALSPEGDLAAFCAKVDAAIASDKLGAGSVEYPELPRYRLSAVFDDNLRVFRSGWKEKI